MTSKSTRATNQSTLTELPPFDNILFNGDNALFTAILLPNPTSAELRKIRINCQLCLGPKPYSAIKDQYNYKSTSNYWTHLKGQHKSTYNRLSPILADNEESSSQANSSKQSSQITTKTSFFYRNPSAITPPQDIKRLIIQFIIANNLSFNSAQSKEFKGLLTALNNSIIPPSKRILKNEINNYYNELLFDLKSKISAIKDKGYAFNLTIDNWTSLIQKAFMGITIHWLDNNWVLKSYLLRLCPLYKKHSGRNLFKVLLETLKDFNIDTNILTITCDNASNNNILIDLFYDYNKSRIPNGYFIKDIRCLAYIINLIV